MILTWEQFNPFNFFFFFANSLCALAIFNFCQQQFHFVSVLFVQQFLLVVENRSKIHNIAHSLLVIEAILQFFSHRTIDRSRLRHRFRRFEALRQLIQLQRFQLHSTLQFVDASRNNRLIDTSQIIKLNQAALAVNGKKKATKKKNHLKCLNLLLYNLNSSRNSSASRFRFFCSAIAFLRCGIE